MDYLKYLPTDYTDKSTWALLLPSGQRLPVHDHLLRNCSPILANLASTEQQHGEFAVEVPFEGDEETAVQFLKWLYRQRTEWTLPLAKKLAKLSHLWDIAGNSLADLVE